ncbi:MAG: AIPR family protein [Propionibacteriaceae bacterium]|jgi:hypothetical protein|nr:AIPR family protein [Propionibacteriaceae bacterium]
MHDTPDQAIAKSNFDDYMVLNYPKLSKDDAFERFTMDLALRTAGATPAEIEDGVVSAATDGGIDGFYIVLNGREFVSVNSTRLGRGKDPLSGLNKGVSLDLVIVQSKNQDSWDTNVFPKIQSALTAILDDQKTAADLRAFPLSEKLVEKALAFRKLRSRIATLLPTQSARVLYMTFAPQSHVDSYMETKREQLESLIRQNLPTGSSVEVAYAGDAELVKRLRVSTEYQGNLKLIGAPIRDEKALVGLVSIEDFLSFVRIEGSKTIRDEMFAVNVRDFAGTNGRVNDAISATLSNDSESAFWWLNNGITIIADQADNPVGTLWVLTNPLIVNGLQTSHVIHDQDLVGKITSNRRKQSLLVRVIPESDQTVRESVIGGTNNQTAISGLQLHANDEKQLRIEDYLRAHGWFYERRRYQYRGMRVSASKIRTPTEVGQAVIAYRLLEPNTARARPATLLGQNAGWTKVFNPDENEELFLKAVVVVDRVDDYLRTPGARGIADDSLNPRYYLVSGYALLASGVRRLEDFAMVPSSALKSSPSDADLTALHTLLYLEVDRLDDKKQAQDRVFKGSDLRVAFLQRVLALNSKDV